jgi:hypothetical protein
LADQLHPERVSGAETAVITDAKLLDYLLNPEHMKGGSKAQFLHTLGYRRELWERLRDDILAAVCVAPAQPSGAIGRNGAKFVAVIQLNGPSRSGRVRTVWAVEEGSPARMITLYPAHGRTIEP